MIYLTDKQIFIWIQNTLLPVSSIFADELGLYMKVYTPFYKDDWLCPNCWEWNIYYALECENCRAKKPEHPGIWGK